MMQAGLPLPQARQATSHIELPLDFHDAECWFFSPNAFIDDADSMDGARRLLSAPMPRSDRASAWLLSQWSGHLAPYLGLSKGEVRALFKQLGAVYTRGTVEDAARLISTCRIFPGYPWLASQNFVRHLHFASNYFSQAVVARARGIPAVPIFAFTKTGSSFLTSFFSQWLNIPTAVASLHHAIGMTPWLRCMAEWPATTHDHMAPTPANLARLHASGLKRCVVHVRNPFEVAVSLAHHMVKRRGLPKTPEQLHAYLDTSMETDMRRYVAWRTLWKQAASGGKIEVLETSYEELRNDFPALALRILDFFGQRGASISALRTQYEAQMEQAGEGKFNFRSGTPDEWKETLTPAQVARIRDIAAQTFPEYMSS